MAGMMNSSKPIQGPGGRTIIPNQIDNNADMVWMQQYAFSQFAREFGIGGMPREQVAKILVPQAKGIMNMNASLYGARIVKMQQDTATRNATDTAANGLVNGENAADTFNRLATEYTPLVVASL